MEASDDDKGWVVVRWGEKRLQLLIRCPSHETINLGKTGLTNGKTGRQGLKPSMCL